ncbi:unnamed protein product [Urochloa humidicola]
MSLAKRKVEELGEQVVSAAVGDVFARTISAAVGRYAAHASLGEQVERLGTLVIMVHSAVEAAEGVHIRSWWLRRWLWRLRDAALDGDEVLRSSLTRQRQQQRAKEEAETAGGGGGRRLWNTLRRVFRSSKSLLLAGDDSTARVSAAVARLESLSTGLPDFLKLLDMEITKSQTPPPPPPPPLPAPQRIPSSAEAAEGNDYRWRKSGSTSMLTRQQYEDAGYLSSPQFFSIEEEEILHGVVDVPPPRRRRGTTLRRFYDVCGSVDEQASLSSKPKKSLVASWKPEEHDLPYTSFKKHVRRTMSRLTTRTPGPTPASSDDLYHPSRLRVLVSDIRRALRASDRPEVHGKMWLAEWRRELHGLADTADRVLLIQDVPETAVAAEAGVATSRVVIGDDDEVRMTAQSVHTAASHLKCFVTLVRLAVSRGIPTA